MGEPIRRRTLAAIAREYESYGRVAPGQPDAPKEFNPGAVFFGVFLPRITTRPVVRPGDTLFPYSFYPATISYQNAVKQLLRNKLKVAVEHNHTYGEEPLTAITGAKQGHVCQFIAVGGSLYYAHIAIPDATQSYLYVDVNGTATNTEDDAFADILFMTNVVNGYAVAMCEKIIAAEMTGEEIVDKLRVSSGNTVTSVTPSRGSVSSATGSASGSYTPVGNITLALDDTSSQARGVKVVVDIQAVDGVLGVETKKLTATFTGVPATITSTVATQNVNVVTDVTSSSANRVLSVTAR